MNQYARDPILRLKEEALSNQEAGSRRYQLADAARSLFPNPAQSETTESLFERELVESEK